jgi:hypothetical protein
MKLAKMLLNQAEDKYNHKDDRAAIRDTIKALQSFITSINCLASLAYEPRKKHKAKKVKVCRSIKSKVDPEAYQPVPSTDPLGEEN